MFMSNGTSRFLEIKLFQASLLSIVVRIRAFFDFLHVLYLRILIDQVICCKAQLIFSSYAGFLFCHIFRLSFLRWVVGCCTFFLLISLQLIILFSISSSCPSVLTTILLLGCGLTIDHTVVWRSLLDHTDFHWSHEISDMDIAFMQLFLVSLPLVLESSPVCVGCPASSWAIYNLDNQSLLMLSLWNQSI